MTKKTRILIAAILTSILSASSLAAEPQEQTYGDTRYVTGGIGQDEAQAMRQAASRYPLSMLFTARTGQYLSDVKVTIKKKNGDTVLSAVSDGPMMLVALPPGQYTVEATAEDKTQTHKVALAKGKHQRLTLRWDKISGT